MALVFQCAINHFDILHPLCLDPRLLEGYKDVGIKETFFGSILIFQKYVIVGAGKLPLHTKRARLRRELRRSAQLSRAVERCPHYKFKHLGCSPFFSDHCNTVFCNSQQSSLTRTFSTQ